jgi:hypothetical protein
VFVTTIIIVIVWWHLIINFALVIKSNMKGGRSLIVYFMSLESSFCFIMILLDPKNFKERRPESKFILNPTTKTVGYSSLKKRKVKNKSGAIECSKMKI